MTKVSGYSASSTLMATCVTLANLTGQHFSKTAKFGQEDDKKAPLQKSSKISIYILMTFPFIKGFFGNKTLNTSIVFCAILSDFVKWSFKTISYC